MVFKRSALLLLAAAAAVVSTNALSIDVESNLKNPIVKKVQQRDGKVILTLQEGKGYAAPKKHHKKKHHQVKKPVVHHKKQVSETREKNEVVKKYPHGKVQIATKESKPVKKHHKKQVTVPPKPAEKPEDEDDEDEEEGSAEDEELEVGEDEEGEMKSFGLPVGDSVDVTVDGETVTLKHFKNGSVVMYAGADVMVLNGADIYLDFDVEDEMEAGSASGSGHGHAEAGAVVAPAPKDTSLVSKIEADVSSVAKKFSELATKLTGNGFKEATPIIMIGGAIGALAAVIGIAAVAVGRARANTAAADPQSVLSDATEDVEADIEAGETQEKKEEDEASDESQALDSSDSESESEVEQEEGKFTNEVASV